jgi:two-component system, chemotaxis family, chemotaxis protein CheY
MVSLGLADDEPDILKLLHTVLSKQGYPIVYMARDGEEAVELNHRTPADILIIDHVMPYKNGIDAAREVIEEYPETHIFLMTCGEEIDDLVMGLKDLTILKKPFSLKNLVALVGEYNGKPAAGDYYIDGSSHAQE